MGILFFKCLPAEVGSSPWYHVEPPEMLLISLFSQHSFPCLQPQLDKSSKVLQFQFKLPFQAQVGDRSTGQVHNRGCSTPGPKHGGPQGHQEKAMQERTCAFYQPHILLPRQSNGLLQKNAD